MAAKTRQKHDYPSPAHRHSYTRRTGAERTFSTIKDPATTSIARGWCRQTGLTPLTLWIACLLTTRNQRILDAFDARQADNARRAAAGLPPKTRKRRRRLTSPASPPPRHKQPPAPPSHTHAAAPLNQAQSPPQPRTHASQAAKAPSCTTHKINSALRSCQQRTSDPNVNMKPGET